LVFGRLNVLRPQSRAPSDQDTTGRRNQLPERRPGHKLGGNAPPAMTSPPSDESGPDDVLAKLRARPPVARDFTTPEGAILCLEDACRRRDIEAAVACKHFLIEGILMLLDYDENLARDPELRERNARLAEQKYRRDLAEAWPNLDGVESFFFGRQAYLDGIVVVTEIRRLPGGSFDKLNFLVTKTKDGWRVLNQISDEGLEDLED